ncbi:MAG: gamma-glutamyltransferase [Burkholderiales bacterium]|nr:gamma-glutamyltransferase [Burkholderiales bacterium]
MTREGRCVYVARAQRWCVRLAACVLVLSCAVQAQDQAPELPSGNVAKQDVRFTRQGVAAANPLAVEAGYAMLRQGGSAIDAAIAAQLVLGLVEPQSSGLGGGAFIVMHDARTGRARSYDGRETAPAAAKPTRFIAPDGLPMKFYDAVVGGRAVGVPGTVALLAEVHRKHGRLPWRTLFGPAIALAQQGFPVSPRLHMQLAGERFLKNDPLSRAYFYTPEGAPWPVGHALKNPDYAKTLIAIRDGGAAAFYAGDIASDIVRAARAQSRASDLTEADFAAYRVIERTPVCTRYRGLRVCGMPPPSSGGIAVAQMLAYIERFPMAAWGPGSLDAVHVFAEAGRLAFADRNRYVADPDFVAIPRGLLDHDYLERRAAQIDLARSMGRAEPGTPPGAQVALAPDATVEVSGTSHLSMVDRYGNAVAMTTTIEDQFGARVMVRGFLLNNELTDFSFVPEEGGRPVANRIEAGKRPRSSIAPTLVYDRHAKPVIVTGSPGGSAIINYVAKSIVALVDWGLTPQQAADLPNFGSRNGPTELERGTSLVSLKPELEQRGHTVSVIDFTSGLHILQRIDGTRGGPWRGGADPRREGIVLGD